MAKNLRQFRFYGPKDLRNYPPVEVTLDSTDSRLGTQPSEEDVEAYKAWLKAKEDIEKNLEIEKYSSGSVFKDVYPIKQLGIQSIPGTKFYLNNSLNPLIIDSSGIYDLEVENGVEINKLEFDKKSLRQLGLIGNYFLLVDILYGEEE